MKTIFLVAGSMLAALGVMIGAFGTHGIKALLLQTGRTDTFETAVRYHFYHALGLILLGILTQQYPEKNLNLAGWLLLSGTVVFSGSLYILCLTNTPWLGAITPIGGLLMIGGWLWLAWQIAK
jgi:uncharacterized membrane protein YgdD (TMEM256/DUF423 family)